MRIFNSRTRVELTRARGSVLIVILGILGALVAIGILISKENVHLPWQSSYSAEVAVSNATGAVPGLDEVRWAGIVVGRITGEKMVNGEPVLTAEMNPSDLGGARLYRDARVELRPQTPLTDMYLNVISRGHRSAGVLGSGQVLQAAQAQTPVNIADVLDTFSEPVRQRLQELLGELATGLGHQGGAQLRDAFGEVAPLLVAQKQLSTTLATRSSLVKTLIHDSGTLFTALNDRNTQLDSLIRNGSATLGALGSESGQLAKLVSELPGTLDQIHSSFGQLQTTLSDVKPTLTALDPTARQLPSGLRALTGFSHSASPALDALNPAIAKLEPLVQNLPATSTSLKHALTALEPQTSQLDNVTTKLVPCELPVDKFFAWSLSVLKFSNADNKTASPRGILATGPFESTLKDPALAPTGGCAGGTTPTTPSHAPIP